jgi:hypothetical protein
VSTTNNFFRPKRHFRSVFREGKFLLNTEATEIELEVLDRLREQIKQAYGPTFSIQDGMLTEADAVVGRVIIRPGYSYVDGYPIDLTSSEDPRFSLGMSPTTLTSSDFVKVAKTVSDKGGLAINFGGGSPVDAGKYLIILETREELITSAQDPYLRSANLSESTADRHRLIVDVHIIPKYIGNNISNGLSLNNSPIPYTGSAANNLVDYINIVPLGSNYSLLSTLPITGAEAIDGRNLEIQINNGNGTTTAAFPTSNANIREYIHGKLVDSNGTEFHISNMFVTPGNSTRITLQLDLEKTRPVQLTTFQTNPVLTDSVSYKLVKRDLFVTSTGQLPEGKKFYPVAELVWNGASFTTSNITDLRPKLLAKDGVLDLIRNQGLNLTSQGGVYWKMSTGDLVWGDSLYIHSAFSGYDWTIPASDTVTLFGGLAVNEVLYVKLSEKPTGGVLTLLKGVRGVGDLTQDSLRASSVFWIAKRLPDNRVYFHGGLTLENKQSGFFYTVKPKRLLPQDILSLGYSSLFDDLLEDSTAFDDLVSTGEFFASSYMLQFSNRVITKAGSNVIQLASAPSFTMHLGDLLIQGSIVAIITAVHSSTEVVVDNDAPLTNSASATVSQVAQTLNLRIVEDGGGAGEQIGSYLNSPVDKILVRYDDNILQAVGNLPRIGFTASSNSGSNWTSAQYRPPALSDVVPEVGITPSGSDVRLRFFSAVTAGDGTSILETFRIFMHKRFFVGSIISGGSAPSASSRTFEFKVFGSIEDPNLEPISAPSYNPLDFVMNSAILVIENGQIGTFKVYIVSYNTDGTGALIHVGQTITLASSGSSIVSLSFSNTTIPANRIVKLLTQYVSGDKTSNISVLLQ